MSSSLYKNDTYVSKDLNYITSAYIREYDIQKANINILLKYGAIDLALYNKLYSNPNRNNIVGLMCRDNKDINETLKNGFVESRRLFFESNQIEDYEILSIKKDAIFLINKIATNTEFEGINFINKNMYTSFYKVGRLEFYYYSDIINNTEKLDIKGINKLTLTNHTEYLLDFLKYVFSLAETTSMDSIVTIISNFYRQYLNLELPSGYYRELNSMSKFKVKTNTINAYYLDYLSEGFDKNLLDISCNREILATLFTYYSNMYMQKR